MKVSEKIKELRAENGWSQEQMAEKLGVSRQAITKWETGTGTPDIENLAAIAQLFGVSTDLLLFGSDSNNNEGDNVRFKRVTSIDVQEEKHYDITIGSARSISVRSTESEKITVLLEANEIANLEKAFKVLLDTEGRNFDIDITNTGIVADALARQQLDVTIEIPATYSSDMELELDANELHIENMDLHLEAAGNVGKIWIADFEGHIELDIAIDMEIWAENVRGKIDVNQIGAVSILHIAHDAPFTAATRGHLGKRTLQFTHNGEPCDALATEEAPLAIELAGARCELTVDTVS